MKILENYFRKILEEHDIRVDGSRPWDVSIINPKLFNRVFLNGSMGLGESYMDGWFECQRLDLFFEKIFSAGLDSRYGNLQYLLSSIVSRLINLQSISRSFIVGEKHYDIGNDLFSVMLDKRMMYTCGYWPKNVSNLEEAQKSKLDLVANKINLKPGMKVLDLGCGWGGAAKYFSESYGVKVIGNTISKEQYLFAKESCAGLDVEILLMDYRDLKDQFDAIYSIGMFEAVGHQNFRKYFQSVDKCLKDDGVFLLHTIGVDKSYTATDPWINKYIFPNGMMPSSKQITTAMEGLFKIDDWHNFGPDYDKTIMCWYKNFTDHYKLLKHSYDQKFYRMWTYWLLQSAASFRTRSNNLWQILLSKSDSKKLDISFR